RFFSALVRIQRDRGHRVVNTGPYRVLRHPGYAGSITTMFGAALALGSRWALGVAAAVSVLLLVVAGAYGFHRDELYFVIAGRHPALGYVDQPPLTPILSAVAVAIFGPTPIAVRILPALSAGLTVAMCADMARRFGGGQVAQVIAAVTVAATGLLAVSHLASTTTYDLFAWTLVLWLAVRLLAGGDRRLWLALGLAAGLGLENKYIIAFLGVGLAVGIVLSRRWDVLRSRWAWAAIGIALLIWLPNLAWQAANDWPQLDMARVLAARARAERGTFLLELLLIGGTFLAFVPIIGTVRLLVARDARPWRAIGWASIVVVVIVVATSGKSYYMAGILPVLIAAGAVPIERWIGRGRTLARPIAFGAAALVAGALMVILALPIVPVASLASTPIPEIYNEASEQVGWPELVATVRSVVDELPAAERERAVILTANYAEAGALELLGGDLPPVFSGHNGYWDWGPPPAGSSVGIIVAGGGWRTTGASDCTTEGKVDNGVGVENEEQGTAIRVCRRMPSDWGRVWPQLRHLD
ncbi:MAG TPA: glycosyltransferase family 39 protein, partial [Candidatus Limnocylindrales bacterium]|nr:glycosyltransferase family 39 protein [Candidatus Limnocylindrales bacterium]